VTRVGRSAALITCVLSFLSGCSASHGHEQDRAVTASRAAARTFLARYVTRDGAVVRRDQGSDVVSEGQAYALLLASIAGDQPAFERVWRWTHAHLLGSDGLLASRAAKDGRVLDRNAASDADLLAAWALVRAQGPRAGRCVTRDDG